MSPFCRHALITMFQETASLSAITPNARLARTKSPHLAYISRTALQSTTSGRTPFLSIQPWMRLPDSTSPSPAQHLRTPARTKAFGAASPSVSISPNARMPSACLPARAQPEMVAVHAGALLLGISSNALCASWKPRALIQELGTEERQRRARAKTASITLEQGSPARRRIQAEEGDEVVSGKSSAAAALLAA
uniref:Uncharacterized protein n=1 Tax=Arundo donax TaxID=35708 RepID=A0A0A8YYS4_ARUDO